MQKLISFDLKAEMGFLKKPDINDGIYLTYNMLHKPALLGILGAIAGFGGYKENMKWPEYYDKLKDLKVGIEPLQSEKGNYQKTVIGYNNTTGFANDDGILQITEQVLIKPSYRCYLLINTDIPDEALLYERILNQQSEFLPYLGKNDFSAWWEKESVREYEFDCRKPTDSFSIKSLFCKNDTTVKNQKEEAFVGFDLFGGSLNDAEVFFYFEKLPMGFNEKLFQYQMADFSYTSAKFKKDSFLANLYYLVSEGQYIQIN